MSDRKPLMLPSLVDNDDSDRNNDNGDDDVVLNVSNENEMQGWSRFLWDQGPPITQKS